jgi:hypothetical protein
MSATPTEALGEELYELMLGPDGASVDAIQRKPRIMGLRCVKAGSSAVNVANPTAEVVASRAREVLKEATDDLAKPLHEREPVDDTDFGAAARCFLGLEQGTESLDRRRRRDKADVHTGEKMTIEAMAKTQKEPPRVSHERKLMDALAGKLMERELDFLRERDGGSQSDMMDDSSWLAAAHDVWYTASQLSSELDGCYGVFRPEPGEEHPFQSDYNARLLFGDFWSLVKIPDQNDPFIADIGKPSEELSTLFAGGMIAVMFAYSPFEREGMEKLSSGKEVSLLSLDEQITLWHAWLESCQCAETTPEPVCKVHRFRAALDAYIKELNKCWDELRDPYRTPSHFTLDRSPRSIFERYGLQAPRLDKYTDYDV